jgi:hypothetical protein
MTYYTMFWYCHAKDDYNYHLATETILVKNGTPEEAMSRLFSTMQSPPGDMQPAIVITNYVH